MSYFRLEHYLPPRVMEKLDLSYIKEELPKLHNTYVGASEKETELEFLKVSIARLQMINLNIFQSKEEVLEGIYLKDQMSITDTMHYLISFIPD